MPQEQIFIETLGWLGAVALLVAYFLVSHQKWSATSIRYNLCNLGGCILLGLNAFYHKAYPSVGINLIWLLIGLNALRLFGRSKRGKSKKD